MNQMLAAKKGQITKEMKELAKQENKEAEVIRKGIAKGHVVITKNLERDCKITGIGKGLRTKINANIGTSPDFKDINEEVKKAKIAVEYGSDTIMDLSIGGNLDGIRHKILKTVDIPVGTVPIYQAVMETVSKNKSIIDMNEDDIFNAIEKLPAVLTIILVILDFIKMVR